MIGARITQSSIVRPQQGPCFFFARRQLREGATWKNTNGLFPPLFFFPAGAAGHQAKVRKGVTLPSASARSVLSACRIQMQLHNMHARLMIESSRGFIGWQREVTAALHGNKVPPPRAVGCSPIRQLYSSCSAFITTRSIASFLLTGVHVGFCPGTRARSTRHASCLSCELIHDYIVG